MDYTYRNIMLRKSIAAQLDALSREVSANLSTDAIIEMAVAGLLKQLEDKTTAEKKAALGVK